MTYAEFPKWKGPTRFAKGNRAHNNAHTKSPTRKDLEKQKGFKLEKKGVGGGREC